MVKYFEEYIDYNLNNYIFKNKLQKLVYNFSTEKITNWITNNPQGILIVIDRKKGDSLQELYSNSSFKINYDYFDKKLWITGSDSLLLWEKHQKNDALDFIFIKNLNVSFKIEENKSINSLWNVDENDIFTATNVNFSVFKINDVIEISTDEKNNNSLFYLMQKENNLGIISDKEYELEFFPFINSNEDNIENKEISYIFKSKILIKGKSNSKINGRKPLFFIPKYENVYQKKMYQIPKNIFPNLSNEEYQIAKRFSLISSKKVDSEENANIIVIKDANNYSGNYDKYINYLTKNSFISGKVDLGREIKSPILINKDIQTKMLLEIDSVEPSKNM